MLDGFVVAPAHFRVFHGHTVSESTAGTACDHVPSVFHPERVESAATDLHLREFMQLEAQVKALRQQQQSGSRLVSVAQSAALAECLSFYTRLMTVESFTWPDFLTAVFTKLADHFVASDSELVKTTVLQVFQDARAHVSQMNDASKIIGHVTNLLDQEEDAVMRIYGLQLFAVVAAAARNEPKLQALLINRLRVVSTRDEKAATAAATKSWLPYSTSLQLAVFPLAMETDCVTLSTLLPHACTDSFQAQQAWSKCSNLYHSQIADEDAFACIAAAFDISKRYPDEIGENMVNLFQYVVLNDPRQAVTQFAWSAMATVVTRLPNATGIVGVLALDHLQSPLVSMTTRSIVMRCLTRCLHDANVATADVVDRVHALVAKEPRYRSILVTALAAFVRHELRTKSSENGDNKNAVSACLKLLFELHPTRFQAAQTLWVKTLHIVEALCLEFHVVIGRTIGEHLLKLAQFASSQNELRGMRGYVWMSLSRVGSCCGTLVYDSHELLTREISKLDSVDVTIQRAICVSFFRSLQGSAPPRAMKEYLLNSNCYSSSTDQYEMARLAFTHGEMQTAVRLIAPLVENLNHECFGSWMHALHAIGKAEVSITTAQAVTMTSLHQALHAMTFMEAAASDKYGFEMQRALLSARSSWMRAMLCAQQYAGEISVTSQVGSHREQALRDLFRTTGSEFTKLRSHLYGVDDADMDILVIHIRLCELLCRAVASFLMLQYPDSSSLVETPMYRGITGRHHYLFRHRDALQTLELGVTEKMVKLQRLPTERQPSVGAQILTQLLQAVCTLSLPLPRMFFRGQVVARQRVRANLQFVTHAEATSYSSKPRARSQLGVAHGTDFTCRLLGGVAFSPELAGSQWSLDDIVSVELDVYLAAATPNKEMTINISDTPRSFVQKTRVTAARAANLCGEEDGKKSDQTVSWEFMRAECAVHVPTALLDSKGSYVVEASISLVDVNGEKWILASTGGRRGIIVY